MLVRVATITFVVAALAYAVAQGLRIRARRDTGDGLVGERPLRTVANVLAGVFAAAAIFLMLAILIQ